MSLTHPIVLNDRRIRSLTEPYPSPTWRTVSCSVATDFSLLPFLPRTLFGIHRVQPVFLRQNRPGFQDSLPGSAPENYTGCRESTPRINAALGRGGV